MSTEQLGGVSFTEYELYICKNKNKGHILNVKTNNQKVFTKYITNANPVLG